MVAVPENSIGALCWIRITASGSNRCSGSGKACIESERRGSEEEEPWMIDTKKNRCECREDIGGQMLDPVKI